MQKRFIRMLLGLAITGLCAVLLGCAKAPLEADAPGILAFKENAYMVQTASETRPDARPLRDQLGVPERVRADFASEDGFITVHADALVSVPEVSKAPILSVKRAQFSQETISYFFDALCKDLVMYSDIDGDMAKPELAEAIRIAEDFLAECADTLHAESLAQARGYLALLQRWYPDAPLTIEEKPVTDGTLQTNHSLDYVTMEPYATGEMVKARNGDVHFTASNDSDLDHIVLVTYNDRGEIDGATCPHWGASVHYYHMGLPPHVCSNLLPASPPMTITDESTAPEEAQGMLHVTPAEARNVAETLLAGTDMAVSDIELVEFGNRDDAGNITDAAYLYAVYCSRVLRGVPCAVMDADTPYSVSYTQEHIFELKWEYEHCVLLYGDDGISDFRWSAPVEVTSVLTERAALLPFSEIMDTFTHMAPVVINTSTENWGGIASVEARVNRVVFCLQRLTNQANLGEGLLVPVWNFYGNVVYHFDGGGTGREATNEYPEIVLSVNAVNGNIMQPRKGY